MRHSLKYMLRLITALLLAVLAVPCVAAPPNILWIIADDLGVQLSCYGDRTVRTPNIDRLASEGVRFTHAFTTAPVCSPSRSALITGMYQTSSGAHHHRSHRLDGYTLPAEVKPITEYLRAAGYFTANVKNIGSGYKVAGKTDFNFTTPKIFDGDDWKQRKAGQPFYAQVNIFEPHRGAAPNVWAHVQSVAPKVDPASVKLPLYLPDHPIVRADWANYLNAIQLLDQKVGAVLDRLRQEGLLDNTVIFFFGDNGQCQIRGKQWLYEAGLHIPLLVRWPQKIKAGTVNHDLISAIDISAASLKLAGIEQPRHLQGQSFLQPDGSLSGSKREYVFGARDRCGEAFDRIRSVRGRRYKYIRNYHPEIPYAQPSNYIDTSYPAISVMRELFAAGKLNSVQSLFMQTRKPAEELYDLSLDPYEINNLAASAKHQAILQKLRLALDGWVAETNDQGALPEPESARKEK